MGLGRSGWVQISLLKSKRFLLGPDGSNRDRAGLVGSKWFQNGSGLVKVGVNGSTFATLAGFGSKGQCRPWRLVPEDLYPT